MHNSGRTQSSFEAGAAVGVLACCAAVAAVVSPARPSGQRAADIVLNAMFVAGLSWLASRAQPWSWFVLGAAAAALAGPWEAECAVSVAIVAAAAGAFGTELRRPIGAAVGAICAAALLWGTTAPVPAGLTSGALAVLTVGASAYRSATAGSRRHWHVVLSAAAFLLCAVVAGFGVAAHQAKRDGDAGFERLHAGMAAARTGDRDAAVVALTAGGRLLHRANRELSRPWALPAIAVPFLGPNASASRQLASTGAQLADAATKAAGNVDLDRFTATPGRIDVAEAHAASPAFTQLALHLQAAGAALERVRSPLLVPPLEHRLTTGRSMVQDAARQARLAVDALGVAPALLGESRPQHYFIAFTTPTEARGRTGFLGNYAEIELAAGKITMTRFGRTGDLDTAGTPLPARRITSPDDYVGRYSRFEPAQTWHNVTMSPDFPSIATVIAQLYRQSGGDDLDGVVSIDPEGLGAFLRLTGPIRVRGIGDPITADNLPTVLYRNQYVELPNTAERIDVLEQLARTTFERLTNDRLPGLRPLLTTLGSAASRGHIQFEAFDPHAKALLHAVNADGAMPAVSGDSLAVIVNNAGGNKIDQFLTTDITYHVRWDPRTQVLTGYADIALHNAAPAAGLPDYIIGSAIKATPGAPKPPTGTNRMLVSVYSPWVPTTSSLDGASVSLRLERELGRLVSSTFLDIPAGQTRTLSMRWAGRLATPSYRLTLVGQPLVHPEQAAVTVETPHSVSSGAFALDRTRIMAVHGG